MHVCARRLTLDLDDAADVLAGGERVSHCHIPCYGAVVPYQLIRQAR